MDLLDFQAQDLYFEQPDVDGVAQLLAIASSSYGTDEAEPALLQAYALAPQSLNVLVALNRFYYYQHRLDEALAISEQALAIIKKPLDFPDDWQAVELEHITKAHASQLTQIRLYLFTLKSIGFLNMRLERLPLSIAIFEKLISLDDCNRLGAVDLLALAKERYLVHEKH